MRRIKPYFNNTNNCIVFASNNDFMPCLAVMLQSIIENQSDKNFYDILILNKDINDVTIRKVSEMIRAYTNISIRFVDVREYIKGLSFFTANRKTITEETYFRLLIPWILDDEYKKAIYLDGDMVVTADIAQICDIDLHNSLIAAVRDYWGICNCYMPNDSMRRYRESIGLLNIDDYIIGGTIIFNLTMFRERFSLVEILDIAVSKQWRQHDQDIINLLCDNKILHISPNYGFMSDYGNNKYLPRYLLDELEQVSDVPYIIHYGGVRKPWNKPYVDYFLIFWKYAYNTPYFEVLLEKIKNYEYKAFIVKKFCAENILVSKNENSIVLSYKNIDLGSFEQMIARYWNIYIDKGVAVFEGLAGFYCVDEKSEIKVYLKINNKFVVATRQVSQNSYTKDNDLIYRAEFFHIEFVLDSKISNYDCRLVVKLNDNYIEMKRIIFEKFAPINNTLKNSYTVLDGYMIVKDINSIMITKCNLIDKFKKEIQFCWSLLRRKETGNIKAIGLRIIGSFAKKFKRKPLWLISDRLSRADDNGEAFFRYINSIDSGINSYFIINKNCADYDRLRKYGNVVAAYSWKHKILSLIADYSISSQTDEVFRNPFFKRNILFMDFLSRVKFVFLQHGIISTDLSAWLNRRKQYIAGFITSTNKEYELILNGKYNYTEKELFLTGLARFDFLEDNKEKVITFLPTWRKYLGVSQDHTNGVWKLIPNFKESKYAVFYSNLLNDSRLLNVANELGYKIQFKIHPSFLAQSNAFELNENIKIVAESDSYRDIYSKSSLIITDYSSSVYDFLYLRKPIIYCQFDKDEFFAGNHMGVLSTFDYERDGFGEVEYDLKSTVDRIIEYMKNDCRIKDKYKERVDRFFAYNDRNNCQRIYEAIKSLDK